MQAKIITISQQKGGCGKTTIAAHIAVALSHNNYKVAIIDIDPQASLTHWYKIREEKLGTDNTGLTFVFASGWRLQNVVNELIPHYNFILIDTPPHTEADTKTAIRISDLVLIPLQPSPTDLWAVNTTMEVAQKEKKKFKIILNRVSPKNKSLKEILSKFTTELLLGSLGNRIAFSHCLLEGKTVTESEPKSQAAAEVASLLQEIKQLTRIKSKELSSL